MNKRSRHAVIAIERGPDRRTRTRETSNGRRKGEDTVVIDDNGMKTYVATKADIARLEEQVKGLDRAIDIRLQGIEALQNERSAALRDVFNLVQIATDKAALAQHNINIATNEWRGSLNDVTKNQASRPEMESVDKRVQALERGASGGQGRSGGLEAFSSKMFSVLALLVALASMFLTWQKLNQVDNNTRDIQRQEAKP